LECRISTFESVKSPFKKACCQGLFLFWLFSHQIPDAHQPDAPSTFFCSLWFSTTKPNQQEATRYD
jgi:hypothetical protein